MALNQTLKVEKSGGQKTTRRHGGPKINPIKNFLLGTKKPKSQQANNKPETTQPQKVLRFQDQVNLQALNQSTAVPSSKSFSSLKRGASLERPEDGDVSQGPVALNEPKKSASESDLLNAEYEVIHEQPEVKAQQNGEFPPPPPPQSLTMDFVVNTGGCDKKDDGYYRSFDDDIDDIDLGGVLATSNSIEAAVVLRNNSQRQSDPPVANANSRFSFNSSSCGDSGTYAETSNSSVTESSDRVYSNTSNCSGDSGIHFSSASDNSSNGSRMDHTSGSMRPQQLEVLTETERTCETEERYATVRKSLTLPHLNGAIKGPNNKTKDLCNFLGVSDEGPGAPSKKVAQKVALQNLKMYQMTSNYGPLPNPLDSMSLSRKNIDRYLGIQEAMTPPESKKLRPKSLGGLISSSPTSYSPNSPSVTKSKAHIMDYGNLNYHNSTSRPSKPPASLALSRLQKSEQIKSAPTTPECPKLPPGQIDGLESPRRKNLAKFLGFGNQDNGAPCQVYQSLSTSTPEDLDGQEGGSERARLWQSNDGLATPGEGTPTRNPDETQIKLPATSLSHYGTLDHSSSIYSQNQGYVFRFSNPLATQQQMIRPGSADRERVTSLQRVSSLQRSFRPSRSSSLQRGRGSSRGSPSRFSQRQSSLGRSDMESSVQWVTKRESKSGLCTRCSNCCGPKIKNISKANETVNPPVAQQVHKVPVKRKGILKTKSFESLDIQSPPPQIVNQTSGCQACDIDVKARNSQQGQQHHPLIIPVNQCDLGSYNPQCCLRLRESCVDEATSRYEPVNPAGSAASAVVSIGYGPTTKVNLHHQNSHEGGGTLLSTQAVVHQNPS